MWIYSKHGFYSIVEDLDNPDLLLVRSRVKGDIERLWPQAKVETTPEHDYAYRARLSRTVVARALAKEAREIDYTNFKDSIAHEDKERAYWYSRVWSIMTCMQAVMVPFKVIK